MEKVLECLGKGSFGEVSRARDLRDDSFVAIKFIAYQSKLEGVPCSVIREISILKELKHDNIVRLLDTFDTEDGFYLVFEYMSQDLFMFIHSTTRAELDPLVIKSFLFQILQGLSYCHSQKVIHRDLKPHNLLIDAGGKTIKLADFGLARSIEVPLPQYTINYRIYSNITNILVFLLELVATLPYTAPEIVLCAPYSSAVDIWSVGYIFAEMERKQILFGGSMHKAVMSHIINMLGEPDEKDWPGVTSACLNLYSATQIPTFGRALGLAASVPRLDAQGLDLLSKMLCFNPKGRITAYEALQHPYLNDLHVNP